MGRVNSIKNCLLDIDCHYFCGAKKNPSLRLGFSNTSLAIPYFRMANCHTIIGAKRFHFRVRDGIGWFTLAMVTKQTGVSVLQPTSLQQVSTNLGFSGLSVALLAALEFCNNLCSLLFSLAIS